MYKKIISMTTAILMCTQLFLPTLTFAKTTNTDK
ncbi:surface antigen msp4 [Peptoniphilus asaccharolyticus DSM 20463]|uniref:Surface antigen msp4 n=1 Tax=Peptoniphilus asaccharolyticus DSM 20463 TaxID=573058 RepID=A0A1W1VER9_PEPAS|nr:surface antigen msp4 [Peptoniphilus asaccharolyticus DSM 20463]